MIQSVPCIFVYVLRRDFKPHSIAVSVMSGFMVYVLPTHNLVLSCGLNQSYFVVIVMDMSFIFSLDLHYKLNKTMKVLNRLLKHSI